MKNKKILVIEKDIVSGELYPPDYFLKKLGSKIKDVAGDVVKLAPQLASPALAAFKPVKKENLKTGFGNVVSKVSSGAGKAGGAVIATVVPAKAIAANKLKTQTAEIDSRLAKSGEAVTSIQTKNTGDLMPKVDIVSGVAGIKGTPVISNQNTSDMTLRERLSNITDSIPAPLRDALRNEGNQLINHGVGRLTQAQQEFAGMRTSPAMLPKTRAVKEAEELIMTPQGTKTTLSASTFSMPSPMVIIAIVALLAIVFYMRKK